MTLRWRPFLLGPAFASQGWNDSPFNVYPVKGRYMWRDMERLCARYGLEVPVLLLRVGDGAERELPRVSPRLGPEALRRWLQEQGVT